MHCLHKTDSLDNDLLLYFIKAICKPATLATVVGLEIALLKYHKQNNFLSDISKEFWK